MKNVTFAHMSSFSSSEIDLPTVLNCVYRRTCTFLQSVCSAMERHASCDYLFSISKIIVLSQVACYNSLPKIAKLCVHYNWQFDEDATHTGFTRLCTFSQEEKSLNANTNLVNMKNSLKGTIINGFNEYPIIFITVLGGFLIFFKPSKNVR